VVLTLRNEEFKAFPAVLREYAHYMNTVMGNSEKTVCEYLLDLRTFFRFLYLKENDMQYSKDEFEKISISSLTVDDIARVNSSEILEFIVFCNIELDNNPTTRMRKISSIRSFYRYAHSKKHYVDFNPAADIDAPKKKKTLPKYLSEAEAVKLLETVRADVSSKTLVRDYTIISLFLNTGMRLSELCGLNLNSINREVTELKVLGKGNKERLIYLNRAATEAIKAYLSIRLDPKYIRTSEKALFLSKRQTRISNKTVQWIVYKYLDLAGLSNRGLSVHKLRHTAATLMYQSGKVDIRVLKEVLGHEQLNTTQIYTHVVDVNMQEAMKNNPLSQINVKNNKNIKIDEK
jgi:site-specific recombinase XerD